MQYLKRLGALGHHAPKAKLLSQGSLLLQEHLAAEAEKPTRRSSLQLFRRSRSSGLDGASSGSPETTMGISRVSSLPLWRAGSGSLGRKSSWRLKEQAVIHA